MAHAVSRASPGDSILLQRGGTYGASNLDAGSSLSFGAYGNGERPIVTASVRVSLPGTWGSNPQVRTGSVAQRVVACYVDGRFVRLARWPNVNAGFLRIDNDDEYDRMLYASGKQNRVVLSHVLHGSPAQNAGLETGDVVLSYDDVRIFTDDDSVEFFLDTNHDRATYFHLGVNTAGRRYDGAVEISDRPKWRSRRCWTISRCSNPRNPQRNPNPSASEVSGSTVKEESFRCSLSRASRSAS